MKTIKRKKTDRSINPKWLAQLLINTDVQTLKEGNLVESILQQVDDNAQISNTPYFGTDIDASTNPNYPESGPLIVHRVYVAGRIGGDSGPYVKKNDWILSISSSGSGTHAAVGGNFYIIPAKVWEVLSVSESLDISGITPKDIIIDPAGSDIELNFVFPVLGHDYRIYFDGDFGSVKINDHDNNEIITFDTKTQSIAIKYYDSSNYIVY